jgi:hypothetical protein
MKAAGGKRGDVLCHAVQSEPNGVAFPGIPHDSPGTGDVDDRLTDAGQIVDLLLNNYGGNSTGIYEARHSGSDRKF